MVESKDLQDRCVILLPTDPGSIPGPIADALKQMLSGGVSSDQSAVVVGRSDTGVEGNRQGERVGPAAGILWGLAGKAANDLYDGVKTVVTDWYSDEQAAKEYIGKKYGWA